ncbi:hypothetical protein [Aquipseudomonas guryensis]|uniref:Lipoprotein n=1 Tax=Aquipseudomonas guryensis TaxID=2759165 RepID=A0A7W4D942_9GAMM|nr:hypothetical protein [Pseudomonas guryensis]MBB1518271.1 hypothetical protein [Pseudomonas guryensis]
MPSIVRGVFCVAVLALAGCAQQPRVEAPAPAPASVQTQADPQRCVTQAECTTKTSRTLLFVFDYAAAGGALVERQERLLFTPADAPRSEWPAIYIRLAEPMSGRFDFNAECQAPSCRYSAEQLLQVYRDYLAGRPGALPRP